MAETLVGRAEDAARAAHAGQVDQQGRDYADHHLRPIAESLVDEGEEAVAAGWLHDVVEDTDWTIERVRAEFGPVVASAVDACTKRAGEPYDQLIERAVADPLGRVVKLADNAHNLSGNDALARLDPAKAAQLREKYERARARLLAT